MKINSFLSRALRLMVVMFGVCAPQARAMDVGISGPLTLFDGEAYWGGYITVLEPIQDGFSLGGETGFQFKSAAAGSVSGTQFIIPILLTGTYDIPANSDAIHPFVGVGLGAAIAQTGVTVTGFGSASDTSAYFQGLLHLGSKFGATKNLFVDIRLGILSSAFVFAPSLGWFF